jgi:hypothetical protein
MGVHMLTARMIANEASLVLAAMMNERPRPVEVRMPPTCADFEAEIWIKFEGLPAVNLKADLNSSLDELSSMLREKLKATAAAAKPQAARQIMIPEEA